MTLNGVTPHVGVWIEMSVQLHRCAGVDRRYGDGGSIASCKTLSRVLKVIYLIINVLTFWSMLDEVKMAPLSRAIAILRLCRAD